MGGAEIPTLQGCLGYLAALECFLEFQAQVVRPPGSAVKGKESGQALDLGRSQLAWIVGTLRLLAKLHERQLL